MTSDSNPTSSEPADVITQPGPITVKAGWWEMRDGHQIQVFEWQPDPRETKNVFKWCGLTPFGDGDVIFWTDGGYCNFDFSAATQEISDNDLVKFLDVPDSVRIRTLNETLEMKHQVIREMEHDLAQRQKTIEAQAAAIQSLQTNIEQKVLHISTARLSDLQQRYNDMVVDRDEWRDRAAQHERMVSSCTMNIEMLQSQLLQMSKRMQSPADTQAVIDGIAALRAEIDRLSAKNESIARLALTKQEENDKLQIRLDAMTNAFESQAETSRQLRDRLEKCLSANAELIASDDAMASLREQVSHPNLSLIVAKLTKPDNQQQQQIIVSGLTILSQLVRKNMDYQGSAFTPPILMPKTSPIVAMCCRASDKIARLANLLSGTRKQVESETVLDTIADLAGYSVLLYSYCNTIQGTAELEAIVEEETMIEEFFATTPDTTTTTIDTTEERQV